MREGDDVVVTRRLALRSCGGIVSGRMLCEPGSSEHAAQIKRSFKKRFGTLRVAVGEPIGKPGGTNTLKIVKVGENRTTH